MKVEKEGPSPSSKILLPCNLQELERNRERREGKKKASKEGGKGRRERKKERGAKDADKL